MRSQTVLLDDEADVLLYTVSVSEAHTSGHTVEQRASPEQASRDASLVSLKEALTVEAATFCEVGQGSLTPTLGVEEHSNTTDSSIDLWTPTSLHHTQGASESTTWSKFWRWFSFAKWTCYTVPPLPPPSPPPPRSAQSTGCLNIYVRLGMNVLWNSHECIVKNLWAAVMCHVPTR